MLFQVAVAVGGSLIHAEVCAVYERHVLLLGKGDMRFKASAYLLPWFELLLFHF